MKKLYIFLSLLLVSAGIVSCTLMMEDFEVPEAERGVGEPYTEIIPDVGYVTYEYNEGVLPFTSEMLNYIAHVEEDSILYIYDYMPQEKVPKVGQLVAAGCTPTIPHGLNSKVLSVENIGGLLRVVTTTVSQDEVYKELEYEIDFNYMPDEENLQEMPDSATLDSLGLTAADFATTDWNVYEKLTRKKMMHRAGKDDNFDEDEYEKEDNEEGLKKSFTIDTRDMKDKGSGILKIVATDLKSNLLKCLSNFPSDYYMVIGMESQETTKYYTKKSKKQKLEINWTETTSTTKYFVEGGFTHGEPFFEKEGDSFNFDDEKLAANYVTRLLARGKSNEGLLKDVKKEIANLEKVKANKAKGKGFLQGVYIPIPAAPAIEFYVQPNVEVSLDLRICGGYAYEEKVVKKTGCREENGVKTIIKEGENEKKSSSQSLYFQGNMEFKAEFGAEVGFRVAKVFGFGAYAYVKGGVEGQVSLEPLGDNIFFNENTYARAYVAAGANLRFNVQPLGFKIMEKDLPIKEWTLVEFKVGAVPTLSTGIVPGSMTVDENQVTFKYQYEIPNSASAVSYFLLLTPTPMLYLYKNGTSDANIVARLAPSSAVKDLRKGQKYTFTYTIDRKDYNSADLYIAMPCMEDKLVGNTLYPDLQYAMEEPKPKAVITYFQQSLGKMVQGYEDLEGFDIDFNQNFDPFDYALYKFTGIVNISHPGLMEDWGVWVDIIHPKKGTLISKFIPINRMKSGSYTLNFSFLANYQPGPGDDLLNVLFVPYYYRNGERVLGDNAKADMQYPFEGKTYSDGTEINLNLN